MTHSAFFLCSPHGTRCYLPPSYAIIEDPDTRPLRFHVLASDPAQADQDLQAFEVGELVAGLPDLSIDWPPQVIV